jgi:amidase
MGDAMTAPRSRALAHLMGAGQLARQVREGHSTATSAVAGALARLARTDGQVRAFTLTRAAAAQDDARAIDEALTGGRAVGALAGVPIAVKGRNGLSSAQAIRLIRAGAIAIGTTSTPRSGGYQTWGDTSRGPTTNPWRTDLSPGGSSAGSAAAVAAGVVPLATGSDGAGSARIPAAWCAIYGYKPTTGLVAGGDPTGLAVPAPLARDPRDLRLWARIVLDVFPDTPPARRATWSSDLGFAIGLDPEATVIAHQAAERLVHTAGLRWRRRPVVLRDPRAAWTQQRARGKPDRHREPGPDRRRGINDAELAELFAETDVLLTPTTPRPAHGHDGPGEHMSVALTWAFNLSGHPAMSIPAGFTRTGAPVGLQVVATHRADSALLALAEACDPAPVAPIAEDAGGAR